MAGPAAQLQGMTSQQQGAPNVPWTKAPLFGDVATSDGMVRMQTCKTFLYSIPAGGSTLGANVEGTDPGAGGGGNPTVQALHQDRNIRSHQTLLTMIDSTSKLYETCSNPPFTTGMHIFNYLPTVVYLRPQDDEAQEYLRKVEAWTWEDLPPDKRDEHLVLNFKAKIVSYNPMRHPNMTLSNNRLIAIFCKGIKTRSPLFTVNQAISI